MNRLPVMFLMMIILLLGAACDTLPPVPASPTVEDTASTSAEVVTVIDGDTIDVLIDGERFRVRYIGVNTPERDEDCYSDATRANADLVSGQTVRLVKDTSETDRYGRLLRYIYVGETFVNADLVETGYAEAVEYPPDTGFADLFNSLERDARAANIGCHPTGVFD